MDHEYKLTKKELHLLIENASFKMKSRTDKRVLKELERELENYCGE